MSQGNIYKQIPSNIREEMFDTLVQGAEIKIERIVSKGHTSPDDGWYDQDQHEWVLVLKGSATIAFKNRASVTLEEGDFLNIPAHSAHRVTGTSEDPATIWLAVHY